MSTEVVIGANPVGEVYIGVQTDTVQNQPIITDWQPNIDKRDNYAGTILVGTDFDATGL